MSPIRTKPGGTFCDVGILNVNQAGDETLEVWIQEIIPGSGDVTVDGAVAYGATDFSEFAVGAGIPAGLTQVDFQAGDPDSFGIADDPEEGHYFAINTSFGVANRFWAFAVDAFDGGHIGEEFGDFEMLARTWIPGAAVATHDLLGPACAMQASGWQAMAMQRTSSGPHLSKVTAKSSSIQTALMQEARQDDVWVWQRFRRISAGGTAYDFYWKAWFGALEDEPAGWDGTSIGTTINVVKFAGAIGFSGQGIPTTEEQRIAFLAFTSDPLNTPPPSGDLGVEGPWVLARSVPVAAGEDQVVRVEDLLEGTRYNVALRYRRGTKYNPGAEDTGDPTTWPSVSRGEFTTTVDPPTFVSAVWSREAADEEQVLLTVTPEDPNDTIVVYREKDGDGAPTAIGSIPGPHGATAEFTDTTIEGETIYRYSFATVGTAGPGAQTAQHRVWTGPSEIPVFRFFTAEGGGYGVAFEDPADDTQGLELHDTYDNVGGTSISFALRAEIDPIGVLTEIFSGELSNIPAPDITFRGKLRFTETAFAVEDFGEFSAEFNVTVPESGGFA